jgi:sugar lactone lactonase YvrE
MNNVQVLIEAKAKLAEGPMWHPIEKKLYWVDIDNCELHRYDPQKGRDSSLNMGQRVSAIVPVKNGDVLAALEDCIAKVNMTSGSIEPVADIEKNITDNRCNDGKCDPAGRFWIGTMNLDAQEGAGSLYRVNADYQVTQILSHQTISNGLVWSVDQKALYYIDSPTYTVQKFDYDNESGEISNPRLVISIPESIGVPDGMTIDKEGMLWIAHWGGACVGRWNPANGKRISEIKVPAPNVTCCTFGGNTMDTLFITTARNGLNKADIAHYPLSGSLFAIDVNVKGLAPNVFR